jgi:Flp pilus assembly pilin Flp
MTTAIRVFLKGERAQDLVEYSLLLGFVALGSAGLMLNSGGSIANVWSSANSKLTGSATTVTSTAALNSTITGGTATGGTVTVYHNDDEHDRR